MKRHVYLNERTWAFSLGLDVHAKVVQHFKLYSNATSALFSNLDTH